MGLTQEKYMQLEDHGAGLKKRSEWATANDLVPDQLYLKTFKHVAHFDVNLLLPGAETHPISVGFAVWKVATGNMVFSTLVTAATSIILVIMPIVG
eukprot:gene31472-6660_t